MSAGSSDPAARAASRLDIAKTAWAEALTAHRMAPPDAAFASRLRMLGNAAELERIACEEAARAGLAWRAMPGAEKSLPPYELRPGTGRRGPQGLWERFDSAVRTLNRAITGPDVAAVAHAFGELASTARTLAEAIDGEDGEAQAGAAA